MSHGGCYENQFLDLFCAHELVKYLLEEYSPPRGCLSSFMLKSRVLVSGEEGVVFLFPN